MSTNSLLTHKKIKLYEKGYSSNFKLPLKKIINTLVYVDIGKVNVIESNRDKIEIFPFFIKQSNFKNVINDNINDVLSIKTGDEYIDNLFEEVIKEKKTDLELSDLFKEMDDQDLEIESLKVKAQDIELELNKYGIVNAIYSDGCIFHDIFKQNILKQALGLIS
ncbi:hypothetical protein IR133_06010 [Staphylococcus saprophyticus]|uniref:hypothetical protein n=1 Tax=Staphylococcus xylosus TaxID=1288 RepID=UPI001073CF70|nr:hypothetical protein [Staphylococcus xylosus]MBF0813264.1 hypothetical protein [Staphylococcus saprophyticus]TFV23940.1 hypothetical protein E4T75_05995 [Staphylococcus saprophyticus]